MSNGERFKETFEQISMSEDRLQALEHLEVCKKKRRARKPAIAFAVICALVILSGKMVLDHDTKDTKYEFVTGEITYYAAESDKEEVQELTEEREERFVLREEHVMVNNDRLSDAVADVYIDEHGLTHYEMSDGSMSAIRIEEPEHTSVFMYEIRFEDGGWTGSITKFIGKIKEKDGKIYVIFNYDWAEMEDITEDFADGVATGKMKCSFDSMQNKIEETFAYRVEGTLEDYTVDVWWVESE